MNKIITISISERGGNIDAGGIDLGTEAGLREALGIVQWAANSLNEALVQLRARALAEELAGKAPAESEG